MKNFTSTAIALFLTIQITTAQFSSMVSENLSTAEVPEFVTRAQTQQFRDGFVTNWEGYKTNSQFKDGVAYFKSTFKKDGRSGNYAYYTPDGILFAYSIFVDVFDLPDTIKEYSLRKYNQAEIISGELIDLEKFQQQIYKVSLSTQGFPTYIYFDEYGHPMEKTDIPQEIFLFF